MAPVDTGGGGLYTRHVISTPADLPVGERPARAELLPETRLERARRSLHRGRVRTGPQTGVADPSGPGSPGTPRGRHTPAVGRRASRSRSTRARTRTHCGTSRWGAPRGGGPGAQGRAERDPVPDGPGRRGPAAGGRDREGDRQVEGGGSRPASSRYSKCGVSKTSMPAARAARTSALRATRISPSSGSREPRTLARKSAAPKRRPAACGARASSGAARTPRAVSTIRKSGVPSSQAATAAIGSPVANSNPVWSTN